MKKWRATVQFAYYLDFEAEAPNYNDAIRIVMEQAQEEAKFAFSDCPQDIVVETALCECMESE